MKIVRKHPNSSSCFVCGLSNDWGLKTRYYELENQQLLGICRGQPEHNSYAGRMHGGVISALLDEIIGRAVQIYEPDTFGVTTDLQVKFKKPVPLGQTIYTIGKITRNNRFLMEGEAKLLNLEGEVLASATAKYLKMTPEQITSTNFADANEWFTEEENTITEIDLPLEWFE